MLFLLIDFPQNLKLGNARGILMTLFYVSLFPPQFLLNFPKIPPHKRISDSPGEKKVKKPNPYNKENFKSEITLVIENFPD